MSKDKSFPHCHAFFRRVVTYFHYTPFSGECTPSSEFLRELRAAGDKNPRIHLNRPNDEHRQRLLRATDMALEMLRENWTEVSNEYAKALAASLK